LLLSMIGMAPRFSRNTGGILAALLVAYSLLKPKALSPASSETVDARARVPPLSASISMLALLVFISGLAAT
jgi:hypothetical protein